MGSKNGKEKSAIAKLPYEIIFNILLKLPITSVLQCRRVCKSWLTIVSDPHFADAHLAQSTVTHSHIILWSRTPQPSSSYKLYFVESETLEICNEVTWIPLKFPQFEIVGSCNGLICLSQSVDDLPVYVCNPLTGQYMALPPCIAQRPCRSAVLGFGFASNTKEYKVVRMLPIDVDFRGWSSRLHVEVYTLGTGYWRSKGTIPYSAPARTYHSYTFVNGALHWILNDSHNWMPGNVIVSFDVGNEEFGVIPSHPEFDPTHIRHVGSIGGCLTIHYHTIGDIEIWMMKDYGVKESWSKYFTCRQTKSLFPLDVQRNGKPILANRFSGKLVIWERETIKFRYGLLLRAIVREQVFTYLHRVPEFDRAYYHVASLITLESACGGEKMSGRERMEIKRKDDEIGQRSISTLAFQKLESWV